MDSVPGALATAAAVTPSIDVIPLDTVEHHFMPPTALFGAYGSSPFHRWWNETPTGISLLKFGSSYQQYQTPTDDDVRAADIAYLGGREYVIPDSEVTALTAAGYGPNIWDVVVPYTAPVMGGVANSGPPPVRTYLAYPDPAVATAGMPQPFLTPSPIVNRSNSVLAGSASAGAFAVVPQISAGTTHTANTQAVPATASAVAVAPVVQGSLAANVTAVPAVGNAASTAPVVSGAAGVAAVTRSGTQLQISGTRWQPVGWDSYVMRSAGGTTTQTMDATQIDAFFSGLPAKSLVRVWAFSPVSGTYTTAQVLAEQDKIVASAKQYGHRLIFTLADWAGNANDGTGAKTVSWLTGGTYTGAYQTWLDTIVQHYANETTIAAWDLLNEPLVPSNSADLKTFVDAMGARVKSWAPWALVMLGIGKPSTACGSTANYQTVMGSSYIDIVSFHDYYEVPGIDDTFVAVRGVANALSKPMLVDEVGVWASSSYSTTTTSPAGYKPVSYANQANILQEKFKLYAAYPEVAGFAVWSEMEAGIADPAYEPQPGATTRTVVDGFSMATGAALLTPGTVANLEGWLKSVDAWRIADGTTTGATHYRRGTANTYSSGFTAAHNAPGGKPAWQNASNATWLDWSAVETTQTWFLVVQPTALTAGTKHYLVGADNGSGGLAIYVDGTTGLVNILNEGSAPFGTSVTGLYTGTTYVVEVHFTKSTGSWSIWINGRQDAYGTGATTGTFAASSNTSLLRQFTWQSGNAFVGYLYDALKFSVDLSSTDSTTVRNYLQAEYGLNPRDFASPTGLSLTSSTTGYSSSLLKGSLTQVGTAASPVNTTYSTAGQVVRDTEFHGMVTVSAANVQFYNCIFHGRNSTTNEACVMTNTQGVSRALFEDCTFNPDHPSVWVNGINGSDYTLRRCDVSNVVDGWGIFNTYRTQPYACHVIVEYTYAHDVAYFSPDVNHSTDNQTHNDTGGQIQGGTGYILRHSNVQGYYGTAGSAQPLPNTSPSPSGYSNVALSCVMFNVNVGDTSGVTITDNYFGGGYIPLNCAGGATSVGTILRNKFDGGSLIMSSGTAKPQTILLKSTQTAITGDGTSDANTFYAGAYAGQEVLVRHNG